MADARQLSRRSLARARQAGASRTTVVVALLANALVFVAKLLGGLLSGSTALLAEAAHSLADTTNQGFVLTSIGLSQREPTEAQPFGYGQQRFLWTFIAAVGMFVAGAVFAIGYGVIELLSGGDRHEGFTAAWVTLGIGFAADGTSWLRALRQVRDEARAANLPLLLYTLTSRDPSVKLVLFEDSAAVVGVLLAAIGIGLHQATGKAFFDPAASIAIGVLLIGVAFWMARDTGRMLVGAAARPDERATIERVLESHPAVVDVSELLTMVLGPNALLVAARIDLEDSLNGGQIEQAANEIDEAVRKAVPDVTEVFLDATPPSHRSGHGDGGR